MQFPNAVAITFRSLLDMSVTKYMQDAGEMKAIKAKLSAKQPKPADWIPTLNQQLNHILQTNTIPLAPEGAEGVAEVRQRHEPITDPGCPELVHPHSICAADSGADAGILDHAHPVA